MRQKKKFWLVDSLMHIMHYAKICATATRHKKINLWEFFIFWLVESVILYALYVIQKYSVIQKYVLQPIIDKKYTRWSTLTPIICLTHFWQVQAGNSLHHYMTRCIVSIKLPTRSYVKTQSSHATCFNALWIEYWLSYYFFFGEDFFYNVFFSYL